MPTNGTIACCCKQQGPRPCVVGCVFDELHSNSTNVIANNTARHTPLQVNTYGALVHYNLIDHDYVLTQFVGAPKTARPIKGAAKCAKQDRLMRRSASQLWEKLHYDTTIESSRSS